MWYVNLVNSLHLAAKEYPSNSPVLLLCKLAHDRLPKDSFTFYLLLITVSLIIQFYQIKELPEALHV